MCVHACVRECVYVLCFHFKGADSYFSMFVDWLRDSLEDMKIKKDEICEYKCVCVCVCV